MRLDIGNPEQPRSIEDPDPASIRQAVYEMNFPNDSFLILGHDDMHYIQCSGTVATGLALEYQDGSLKKHYLTDEIFDAESIIQKFTDYLEGNDSWWYGVDWKRMIEIP